MLSVWSTEGIETAEQWGRARSAGSDHGQGYYFARPILGEPMSARSHLRLTCYHAEGLTGEPLREPPPANGVSRSDRFFAYAFLLSRYSASADPVRAYLTQPVLSSAASSA